jgi:transcriptional regulator with XRE-family HTH domain
VRPSTDARVLLGQRVRETRLKLRLSQESLADAADLHRTYVGAVERGERNISLLNIVRLARALGTTASRLLEGIK